MSALKRTLITVVINALILGFLFLATTFAVIYNKVKTISIEAKSEYRASTIQSLVLQMNDEYKDFQTRNNAIWALGQLGDAYALKYLDHIKTGIPDKNRSNLKTEISMYEINKAIKHINGFALTQWMYRDYHNW